MAKKITTCCAANGIICDQCGDCPSPRYLPSANLLHKLEFWQIVPQQGHMAGADVWRRPQAAGGYLQVTRGLETGIVVITDNHRLDGENGKPGPWMKEPYHAAPLLDDAQFKAILDIASTAS